MAAGQPWALAVQADAAGPAERRQLAALIGSAIEADPNRLLLSTCHRVELYGVGPVPELDPRLRLESGERAVRHLMRVAAGLESAVIGEDEVLHQVRDALRMGRESRKLDTGLQRLFESAIAAGRQARAGRTNSSGNLAHRAVDWLLGRSRLDGRDVVVAGAGRMGSALAHAAAGAGANVTIASRNRDRARRLARIYKGRGVDLECGARLVTSSSGVLVALAGSWNELRPSEGVMPPMADISAPSAVSPAVRGRLNGSFLGIDDLYTHPGPPPRGYVEVAEAVVAGKTAEYLDWLERAS